MAKRTHDRAAEILKDFSFEADKEPAPMSPFMQTAAAQATFGMFRNGLG